VYSPSDVTLGRCTAAMHNSEVGICTSQRQLTELQVCDSFYLEPYGVSILIRTEQNMDMH
jgi:hypothetical protein